MKILFTIASLSSGGAERVLALVANELALRNYEVFIITICKNEIFFELDKKITIIQLDLCGTSNNIMHAIARNIKIIYLLRKHFNMLHPSVIISFMNTVNIESIFANLGLDSKIILTEHSDHFFTNLDKKWHMLQKIVYRYSNLLVSVSKGVDKYFSFLNSEKRTIIYNPVEKHIEEKSDINIDNINIDIYKKYIINVGRLEQEKRHDQLIKSFNLLKNKEINLLIFGEGSLKNQLQSLIEELNLTKRVFLMGRVKNPYFFMKHAEFFVLSSEYEGFGNVLIEAMSVGCPAISFDCPSGPAEIIHNGINGILVENQNLEALSQAMQLLIDNDNLRHKLSNESLKAKERYAIEKISHQWESLITKITSI